MNENLPSPGYQESAVVEHELKPIARSEILDRHPTNESREDTLAERKEGSTLNDSHQLKKKNLSFR